jgi:hypothetical protein
VHSSLAIEKGKLMLANNEILVFQPCTARRESKGISLLQGTCYPAGSHSASSTGYGLGWPEKMGANFLL